MEFRDVIESDVPVFFEHHRESLPARSAERISEERARFVAKWAATRSDHSKYAQTIIVDGEVAGYIAKFPRLGVVEVSYWIGRAFWGRGVATAALARFLRFVRERPIFARVAVSNHASLRVLEKCNFTIQADAASLARSSEEYGEEHLLRRDHE